MAVHHDNFDLWDSQHTRWNAVDMGPKKDIVGAWAEAARREGLRFGVSDHLWISYKWFSTCKGHDTTGPMAGVPYDGVLKEFADLYHDSPGRHETGLGRHRHSRRVEAAMVPAHQGPGGQVRAGPAVFRWPNPVRRLRPGDARAHCTTGVPRATADMPTRSTPASAAKTPTRARASSTSNAASSRPSGLARGRPTPASATGTTNGA